MKEHWIDTSWRIYRTLWLRCIIALALVSTLIICAAIVRSRHIKTQEADAMVINISGRQRMLSQRIAMMALQYTTTSLTQRETIRATLSADLRLMADTHVVLMKEMRETTSTNTKAFDHATLDRAVNDYLGHVKGLLALSDQQRASKLTIIETILKASQPLLHQLNDAVTWHEQNAQTKLKKLELIDLVLNTITLITLGFIGVFIIRPMIYDVATHVSTNARDREKIATTNQELETRRQENEREIMARHAAESASHAKSQFLASMSHELRTPLNAIIGYSEMLLEDFEDDAVVSDDLQRILDSSQHLLTLINNVLDISKVEAGKLHIQSQKFTLDVLLKKLETTAAPLMRKNANQLHIDAQQLKFALYTDYQRLFQIVLNLLSNAAKFTSNGVVTLRATIDEDQLIIEVKDTGIGISEEAQARIFKAFEQADMSTTREYGGTGLGLALCQKMAHALGGHVDVHAQLGHGSTFKVVIPHHLEAQPPA